MSETPQPRRTRSHVASYVDGVIHRLVPSGGSQTGPRARAQLAQLRRGVGREPGTVPEIWGLTLDGLDCPGPGDAPSREENAVHVALTMFAVHQQSRAVSMSTNISFGQAVRRLATTVSNGSEDVHEGPVYRRFTELATAASLDELTHHARALVTQMRAADIGFDYGRFADDLVAFQDPRRAGEVRRRWGRDFHHVPSDESAHSAANTSPDSPTIPTEGALA